MEFRLLGSLEVLARGRSLALGGHKQRAVLAMLLLHANEVVSIDRLIDGAWGPPHPEVQSPHSRTRSLGCGGSSGPDSIETRAPGYLLDAPDAAIDARWFETLVDEARSSPARERVALLTQALSLWRGPALADFGFDDFAQAAVQRLDELRLEATEGRVGALLELSRHAEVMGEIEALAATHPSRERLRYLQMLALYRSGRQVDALEVFQETRLALAEELGLEPSEELKALERMILAHDPALADVGTGDTPASGASTREARRVVTVLFVEPVLPDGLGVDADRAAAARCLAVAASVVERHGGRIEQLEGTELAGAFGLPIAHEDDALRAARAATEIRVEWASIDVPVRCGIETGALDVVGDRLDDVSLGVACSVKDAASAGEILIGAAAFRATCRSRRRRAGRGVAIQAAWADRGRTRRAAALRGGSGRAGGRGGGAPGVHRSRLGRWSGELARRARRARDRQDEARSGPRLATRGRRCSASRVGASRTARERRTCRWQMSSERRVGPGDLRRNIARRAAGIPDEDLVVERLVGVVTGDAAAVPSSEAFWAVRRFLEALARERPLLVVLDDVHWAEPTLLDLVEYVAGWSEAPIAVLALARLELIEARPAWANGAVVLEPLSDAAARALLDALPERALVEDDAVGTMLDSADGNPLFLEQIAAFAAERPLAPGEVPPTLETLLASRLDFLSEAERDVIERAAVVGREFSREAVDALSPPDEVAAVGPSLMALMRRRLVRPDRAAPVGEDGFRFEHVLIREAAYASIPRIRRAGLHERLARWLGAASARKEVIGFHLEQACIDGNGDAGIRREAATVLGEAAEEAIWSLDTAAAVGLLRRAVALVLADDSLRRPLEIELGYALKNEGNVAESIDVLTAVEDWARRSGDRRAELRASVELAWPRLMSGEISAAEVRDARGRGNSLVRGCRRAFVPPDGPHGLGRTQTTCSCCTAPRRTTPCGRPGSSNEPASRRSRSQPSSASSTVGPIPVDIVLDRVASALADASPLAGGVGVSPYVRRPPRSHAGLLRDSARAHPAGRAIASRVRAVLCSRHRLAVRSGSG